MDRELRTGIPAVDAALRSLRESIAAPGRGNVWVEVSRDEAPQDKGDKRIFSRKGPLTRDIPLKAAVDNYIPNPLSSAPSGRLILWIGSTTFLTDVTPDDPVAWLVLRSTLDCTVRVQVVP